MAHIGHENFILIFQSLRTVSFSYQLLSFAKTTVIADSAFRYVLSVQDNSYIYVQINPFKYEKSPFHPVYDCMVNIGLF